MSNEILKPVEIFYSYSHKDEKFRDELETHLSLLRRGGFITGWHDRRIGAGTEWKTSIDEHLESAGIILLLISPDFLASDYCYDVELKRAMERHENGEVRVIPVILRKCDWSFAPFAKLQALPKDANPITSWGDIDDAFANVATGIKSIVTELDRLNAATTNVQYVVEIRTVKLRYQVNGKEYVASEGETLKAMKGDSLFLKNLELNLELEKPGSEAKIQAEATLRKPEIKTQDNYDYRDARNTDTTRAIEISKTGELNFQSNSAWVMKEGWDHLVIAFVQYPGTIVFKRCFFPILILS